MNEFTNKRFLSNFIGGGFFSIPKRAIKVFGIEKTVWLTALFEWRNLLLDSGNLPEDDFFYLKQDSVQEVTSLSTDKQTAFIKFFRDAGIIEVQRRGIPAKNFYRINTDAMIETIESELAEISARKEAQKQSEAPEKPSISRSRETRFLENGEHGFINNKIKSELIKTSHEVSNELLPSFDGIRCDAASPSSIDVSSDEMGFPEEGTPIVHKRFRRSIQKEKTSQVTAALVQAMNGKHPLPANKPTFAMKRISEEIHLLMEHWVTLGFNIPDPQKAPKTYNKTVRAIKKITEGCYIPAEKRKFTYEEIKEAMDKFALTVFNMDYGPNQGIKDKLAQKSLLEFIYSPHSRGDRSWLLRCIDEPVQTRTDTKIVPNSHPEVTNRIKGFYCRYVLAGFKKRFSEREENKFREAANRIAELMEKKGHRFVGITNGNFEMADLLCQSIVEYYGEKVDRVTPGSFCSSFAFSRLIAYMNSHGYIVDAESQQYH